MRGLTLGQIGADIKGCNFKEIPQKTRSRENYNHYQYNIFMAMDL